MYTRCPDCHVVYPLRAESLIQAGGEVSCGRCQKTFSVLQHLYDRWPEPGDQPVAVDDENLPSVLSRELPRRPDDPGPMDLGDLDDDQEGLPEPYKRDRLWYVLAVLFGLITVANAIWSFRETETLRPLAEKLGLVDPVPVVQPEPPQYFQLVSRDMHPHPSVQNALILSAAMVNRAERLLPYPVVEITLFDAGQRAVGSRRFQPYEYLAPDADPDAGLAPDVLLAFVLELEDPGPQTVGFEISFL